MGNRLLVGIEYCYEQVLVEGLPNPIICALEKGHPGKHAGAAFISWSRES